MPSSLWLRLAQIGIFNQSPVLLLNSSIAPQICTNLCSIFGAARFTTQQATSWYFAAQFLLRVGLKIDNPFINW